MRTPESRVERYDAAATASVVHDSHLTSGSVPLAITNIVRNLLLDERAYFDAEVNATLMSQRLNNADSGGGAVRVQCARELQAGGITLPDGSVTAPMSATAADKAASDHPTYVEHKRLLAELRDICLEATAEREMAKALDGYSFLRTNPSQKSLPCEELNRAEFSAMPFFELMYL